MLKVAREIKSTRAIYFSCKMKVVIIPKTEISEIHVKWKCKSLNRYITMTIKLFNFPVRIYVDTQFMGLGDSNLDWLNLVKLLVVLVDNA